jgi:GLPGLI family protein
MKKLTTLFALCFSLLLSAQDFEGVIEYEITYEELDDQMKPYEAMMPKSSTVEIKGDMARVITPNPATGGSNTVITNSKTQEAITLMDIMGNKVALKSDAEAKDEDNPEVEYEEETKEIQGYTCKKATVEADGTEMTIYYTEELPSINLDNTGSIKGFPMELTMENSMMTMVQKVKSMERKEVKEIKMEVPKDYKLVTKEELKEMFGGGGM